MVCGTIKPFWSGTDDFSERLTAALRAAGTAVNWAEPTRWATDAFMEVRRAIRRCGDDVVVVQYPTDAIGVSLSPHLYALTKGATPIVTTLHEFSHANPLRKASLSVLLTASAAVVVTTQKEFDALARWYPWLRGRMAIIPIGPTVPAREWAPSAAFDVVNYGQIRAQKGLETFLECARRARAAGRPYRFTICGSPVPRFADYAEALEAEARDCGVTIEKNLPKDELADRLARASVCYFPFPDGASFRRSSILDAAACGAPLLTTTGESTPADFPSSIAIANSAQDALAALDRWAADPAALRRAHDNSAAYAARTSWPTIAREYRTVIAKVAERSGRRGP